MLCGWGVKAGMACLQVKLCVAVSERFRKCNWYLKALYTNVHVYCFTLTVKVTVFLKQIIISTVQILAALLKVDPRVRRRTGWQEK